jgi:hypothetical protein
MEPSDLLNDPCISFWFKNAFRKAIERDPVDALVDAELLLFSLKSHFAPLLEGTFSEP